jgi:hypothetical protein
MKQTNSWFSSWSNLTVGRLLFLTTMLAPVHTRGDGALLFRAAFAARRELRMSNWMAMTDDMQGPPESKADLLARTDRAWAELQATIANFSPEQLTSPTDAGGWTAKDHLAHLTAWERSMIFLLQHRARHEGLGVSESLYLTGDEDAINASIQKQTRALPLDQVLAELTATHEELLALVRELPESELRQPYSYFLPDDPGIDSGEPIIWRISGNTNEHFALHRGYIEHIARQ